MSATAAGRLFADALISRFANPDALVAGIKAACDEVGVPVPRIGDYSRMEFMVALEERLTGHLNDALSDVVAEARPSEEES